MKSIDLCITIDGFKLEDHELVQWGTEYGKIAHLFFGSTLEYNVECATFRGWVVRNSILSEILFKRRFNFRNATHTVQSPTADDSKISNTLATFTCHYIL